MVTASELPINTKANATAMANEIFGNGVQVVGASYTGWNQASGIYTGGDTVAPGVTPSDSGVILSTGRAKDFTNSFGPANQSTSTSTNTKGVDNDAGFNAIAGGPTHDASYLDVDFIPTGNTMSMQFVFSSDEYPEFANSIYNDVVGVWINGTHVPLAVGNGPASVGSVNTTSNQNLYVDNTASTYNTEMDGFTVTMTLKIPVASGQLNSIRIGIADTGDSAYDSNLLIAGGSVQTTLVATDDTMTIAPTATKTIDVLANDTSTTGGTLTITHINGQAVVAGDSVVLTTGQVLTLNADGTIDVTNTTALGDTNFTYEVTDGSGQSDVGFVTLKSVPCFVAGTMILTPGGQVPVQDLNPGDLVVTHDDGPQPLRWIGSRRVDATGDFAPICIAAGTFGDHDTLLVSPQHRILIQDIHAELLFGEAEVLVAAKHLINDHSVRALPGGTVEYIHLLFDRHQVIYSDGLATESFLPGPQTTGSFEAEVVAEIRSLFPQIDMQTGQGYSRSARPALKAYEAGLLRAGAGATQTQAQTAAA